MDVLAPQQLGSPDDQTDEQKRIVQLVNTRFSASNKLHKPLEDKWNVWYGLEHNYRRLQRQHAQATSANDVDTVMQDFRRVFGEELFIPYVHSVIETNAARLFANDPRIVAKPNSPEAYPACNPVKRLFERDQKSMHYAITLQETGRSGLTYGLGVQKSYWHKRYRSGQEVVPKVEGDGYKLETNDQICVFNGPMVEAVDIFDFFWDPAAKNLDTAAYVIHRTWRDIGWIKDRVAEGQKRREMGEDGGWEDLDLEDIKSLASSKGRGEVWAERYAASGLTDYDVEGNDLFEVWEYHDRDNVYTVLGQTLLVQNAPNPFLHGDFPFQIFRPTLRPHEFCGKGEVEPIAHLQYELNTLRGQRRDAATMALNPPFFYSRGMLNPHKIVWGAGIFIPVTGDPKDSVHQAQIRDIPASSVSEEEALKRDIEMSTGISESSTGGGGEATATGTQLVQAATNQRVRLKLKNLHNDLLVPEVAQRRELYRQNLAAYDDPQNPELIRLEDERTPSGYAFIEVTPEHLMADMDVEPIDGSTEAENEVQKRTDAAQLVDALSPFIEAGKVDPGAVTRYVLEQFGHPKPEELMEPPGPEPEAIVNAVAMAMQAASAPPELIDQVLTEALRILEENPEPEVEPEGGASEGEAPPSPEEDLPPGG